MKQILISILITICVVVPLTGEAQAISDYLIMNDIGSYRLSKPTKSIPGFKPVGGPRTYDGAGVVSGSGHFDDHKDTSYEVMYLGGNGLPSPTVTVVQHDGADSDQWLLHEIERDFRTYYGLPGDSFIFREIDGNHILATIAGGGDYRWLSGNKVIRIEYTDLQLEKPEPLAVVKAYLAKHPSTLSAQTSAGLRTDSSKTTWIKDEMARRLWLCERWYAQVEAGKSTEAEILRHIHNHLETFVNYKEKYYGINGKTDREALGTYKYQKNHTAIKAKYEELNQWWTDNKDGDITLP